MEIKSSNRINAELQATPEQSDIQPQNKSQQPSGISSTPDTLEAAAQNANDEVLVQFTSGDFRQPVVTGDLWKSEERPPEMETKINWEAVSAIRLELGKENPDVSLISQSLDKLGSLPSTIDEEIKKWEEKLNSVGDDAQLANVDLQNILQKQQQTLQMMSNISKMLYDTAQAVIRKLGG